MQIFSDKLGNRVQYDATSPITWRLTVYALAVRGGRVLMTEPPWSPRWELPGGAVEPGESLMEGLARECWEETGCHFSPTSPDPLHFGEQFFYDDDLARYCHAVIAVFRGAVQDGVSGQWSPPPDEVRRVAWVEAAVLHPGNTRSIQWPALVKAGLVKASST